MSEDKKVITTPEVESVSNIPRCTWFDEFKTEPCPAQLANKKDMQKGVVVTDSEMVADEIRQWIGYTFKCPVCEEESILDIMKFCGNCGTRVIIKSHKVTAYINQLAAKRQ